MCFLLSYCRFFSLYVGNARVKSTQLRCLTPILRTKMFTKFLWRKSLYFFDQGVKNWLLAVVLRKLCRMVELSRCFVVKHSVNTLFLTSRPLPISWTRGLKAFPPKLYISWTVAYFSHFTHQFTLHIPFSRNLLRFLIC